MAYVPQDPSEFVPPFDGAGDPYDTLWTNHGAVIAEYEQHLGTSCHQVSTSGTTPLVFRFKARGGAGLGDITVSMRADPNGSTFDMVLADSGATCTATTSVTGASLATFTVTVTPTVADTDYTLTLTRTAGAGVLEVKGFVATSATPASPLLIADLVPDDPSSYWAAVGRAINTEHMQRMLNAPMALTKDRPHCLFSHILADTALSSLKGVPDFELWGMQATAATAGQYTMAGFGAINIEDQRPRTVTIDAYIAADDPATALAELRVGGFTWAPAMSGWSRTTLTLSAGWHDVVATVSAADTEAAGWQSIQIWRL
jgi:hypothetical protein